MAQLLCDSNINFTAASWKVIDSTSYLNSEASNTTVTTSFVASSTFTPGAITVEGVMVKLNYILSSTGTITVELYNSTAGASVAGATLTVNVSALPQQLVNTTGCHGFVYFKFAAPVLLLGATLYSIRVRTSSSNTVSLAGASSNWTRCLVTSTTAAPSATDNLFICAPYITTTAPSVITCTFNNTAATSFGSLELGAYGKMVLENNASTAYLLTIATGGLIILGLNSVMEIGTSANRVQSTSSMRIDLPCATNGANGIQNRHLSTLTMYGTQRTRMAKLAANSSIGATSLTTNISTGWKNGDLIAFANTTRGGTTERKALTADASGTTLTITAMDAAKLGTGLIICDIGNLTSNVQIYGTSATLNFYLQSGVNALGITPMLDLDNIEMRYVGGVVSDRLGIQIYNTSSSFTTNITNCAIHEGTNRLISLGGNLTNLNIQNNVLWGANYGFVTGINSSTAGTRVFSNNLILAQTYRGIWMNPQISTDSLVISNNIISGVNVYAIELNLTDNTTCLTDNLTYGNANSGFYGILTRSKVTNLSCYISNYYGAQITGYDSIWDGGLLFGNQWTNIGIATGYNMIYRNLSIQNYSVAGTVAAVVINAGGVRQTYFDNCLIGTVLPHSRTAETLTSLFDLTFRNCTINDSTYTFLYWSLTNVSKVSFQKINCTIGNNRFYKGMGYSQNDTTIFDVGPSSQRLVPSSTSQKLWSTIFQVPITSGSVTSVSVRVRKSTAGDGTAYTGNQPRLILRLNPTVGSSTYDNDIVCATASAAAGTWETLSYTLPSVVTDNVGMEFYVDCDGTTGWVNVDTFISNNNNSMTYYLNGEPIQDIVVASGGETSFIFLS